ncbi:hypothetical protein QFC24_005452 [Naganishia onofrii]|uniref:Uncharacterized protein n=1 Tax=Naganishia onofrii TaxID=1851511 RepID=A0ACC2X9D0_9TREE|nr:hypothetical protein QFC24_005452 [Naganishia onofrii]
MSFLALPTEVLDIIVDYLNPGPPGSAYYRAYAPTACLCNIDEVLAREQGSYLMSVESKRSILALSSACKSSRMAIFDRLFLEKVMLDWKADSLQQGRLLLDVPARGKVQTLILQANSIGRASLRPPLADYIKLFPRLHEIQINLVYPCMHDRRKHLGPHQSVNMGNQMTTSPSATASDTTQRGSSLQSVNLAIYQAISFRGRTDEGFTKKSLRDFASADHLEKLNMARLDKYHLELTFSRSRSSRSGPTFWNEFMLRMENACQIPAKNVSMCFSFQLNGESERFLAELSRAIVHWPKGVEDISFCLQLDEFVLGGYRRILDLVKQGNDGKLELVNGYLPSKLDLDRFVQTMRETRPNLRNFDLVIYTFRAYNCPLLEYHHIAANGGVKDQVPGVSSAFSIEYSELDRLHAKYLEWEGIYSDNDEEVYGFGTELQEYQGEMEEMIGMHEQAASEEYGYKYFYEDLSDSEDSSFLSE